MIKNAKFVADYESTKYDESIWDCFKKHGRFSIDGRVKCLSVNYHAPFKYAVPKGRSITIYKASTDNKHRRVGGFSKNVTSCNFRQDGKMIIGGEEGGLLRFCTTDRNTYHLRKFQGHDGDIIHADFLSNGLKAISLGKDGFAKVWDVSVGELISKFHVSQGGEPPSCMAVGKVDSNLFVTGDFNRNVVLYDLRQPKPIHTFTTRSAASAVHLASDDRIVVASADQYVYTWEAATAKPYFQTSLDVEDRSIHPGGYMHYKLVTGLKVLQCPDVSQDPLLLSVGMDRLLRITNLRTFQEFHQERMPSPCTALGVFPDLRHVVVGCENGLVRSFSFTTPTAVIKNAAKVAKIENSEPFAQLDPSLESLVSKFSGKWRGINLDEGDKTLSTEEWFKRSNDKQGPRIAPKDWGFEGARAPLIHEDTEISRAPTSAFNSTKDDLPLVRLASTLLRFQHSKALNDSLRMRMQLGQASGRRAGLGKASSVSSYVYPVAVVHELSKRGTLAAAVSGQTPVQLEYLLRFIRRNLWLKPATPTCVLLFKIISKVYSRNVLAASEEYLKSCRLLKCLANNNTTVQSLALKMRALLYPQLMSAESPVTSVAAPIETPKRSLRSSSVAHQGSTEKGVHDAKEEGLEDLGVPKKRQRKSVGHTPKSEKRQSIGAKSAKRRRN